MTGFTQTEADFVNRAYDQALTLIGNLLDCNAKRQSAIRDAAIQTLTDLNEQIVDIGFFEGGQNFSWEEIEATVNAANDIGAIEESLNEAHELTLMEMESDFARVIGKIALDEYRNVLSLVWFRKKRNRRYSDYLPKKIPDEISDEFHVLMFNGTQGWMNARAKQIQDISRLKCLNSDDFNPYEFEDQVRSIGYRCGEAAIDNYVELQMLKEAERQAKAANEVSIGGQIWDVIGWDSPTDFLSDIVLTAATGGVGKIVKWGVKLKKATSRARKVADKLERSLNIPDRARRLEHRANDIRQTAERLRKSNKFVKLPQEIAKTLKLLQEARHQIHLAETVGRTVTKDYIRDVATGIAGKLPTGSNMTIGGEATKEMALTSIRALLEGTALGKEIKNRKGTINFTLLINGNDSKNTERLLSYLGLLMAREFLARLALAVARKLRFRVEYIVNEFIDSLTAAIEMVLVDIPLMRKLMSADQQKEIPKYIVSTIQESIAEYGKKLANQLIT